MDNYLINKALLFTADHFNNSNHNFGKPVYFHCLNVAYKAIELGYNETIILGSIMHDLLEDTACTPKEISDNFGEYMGELVRALSFNFATKDKLQRNIDMIDNCQDFGKEALIIKCLDVADTAPFFSLSSEENKRYLRKKYKYLIDVCEKNIQDEPVFGFLMTQINEQEIL
ncbi:HD domain-containing protein [Facklamia sp. DSM 111018]|uniref:HD domain-containing protein n=1 Tax=Facklamia lactis TaxID=2749967 RepID=A0ABS0LT17_9LACT|nr:HD domain-containing protein [Facklamia lactis]MBG9987296.1 HD domain-containing protein [Facklamia lactis]